MYLNEVVRADWVDLYTQHLQLERTGSTPDHTWTQKKSSRCHWWWAAFCGHRCSLLSRHKTQQFQWHSKWVIPPKKQIGYYINRSLFHNISHPNPFQATALYRNWIEQIQVGGQTWFVTNERSPLSCSSEKMSGSGEYKVLKRKERSFTVSLSQFCIIGGNVDVQY